MCRSVGLLLVLNLSLLTCGCAWMGKGEQAATDDASDRVAAVDASEPVWLAAPRPGLSAVGNDYLFVGPMSVNRDGSPQNYLWFAVGTTIDRRLTGAPAPVLDTVVLIVDGTPMTFDLVPWEESSRPAPFDLTIDSYASYAARITASQIRQLANASILDAYVTDAEGRSPLFTTVAGDPSNWRRF